MGISTAGTLGVVWVQDLRLGSGVVPLVLLVY